MSEPPEPKLLDDEVLLLRRTGRRSRDLATGFAKPGAFRLRITADELSLSFYDATLVSAREVLVGAPASGWGVASITVGQLRGLNFEVVRDPVPGSGTLGRAHVAATPHAYEAGQIPEEIQVRLAMTIQWVILSER